MQALERAVQQVGAWPKPLASASDVDEVKLGEKSAEKVRCWPGCSAGFFIGLWCCWGQLQL